MTYTNALNPSQQESGFIPGDLDFLEEMDDWQIAEGERDPRGYTLIGLGQESIGSIENLLVSPTTQRAHFAVVDTGGWFSNKRFLIPMQSIHLRNGEAYCAFTKEQFENGPEWHEDEADYVRHFSYWSGLGSGQVAAGAATASAEEAVIPVIEEELHVGKRQIEHGVRITSRVTEKPVEESVQLREERVMVDRQPVDRALTEADRDALAEGVIDVTAREEVPVVSKEARVVEEVRVGKEVRERTETVRDTVRHTDVEIDEEVDSDIPATPVRPVR